MDTEEQSWNSQAAWKDLPLLHRMEERVRVRRQAVRRESAPPLTLVLSPLLRRGERKERGGVTGSAFVSSLGKKSYWLRAQHPRGHGVHGDGTKPASFAGESRWHHSCIANRNRSRPARAD
jgi:hypothetical protein